MSAAAQILLSGSQAARMTSACWLIWVRVVPVMQLWCTGVALTRSSTILVGVRMGMHSAGQRYMLGQPLPGNGTDVVVTGQQAHTAGERCPSLEGCTRQARSLPSTRNLQGDDSPFYKSG